MKNILNNYSITLLMSSLMVLTPLAKANSLNLSSVRFVSNTDDKLLVGSSLEITGDGNIYAVDGFNNSLQALNPITPFFQPTGNNGQFRWTKLISIDTAGNIERTSEITYKGFNNVYVVDGINNQVQALTLDGTGNIHLVDGINNTIQVFNSQNSASSLPNDKVKEFTWSKSLKIDKTNKINQSNQVGFKNANHNLYQIDGFNQNSNITLNPSAKSRDNFYLVDGINNNLEVLLNDSDLINLLSNINDESDWSWDWVFNNQNNSESNINFSNFFGNRQPLNNGQGNLPNNFMSTILNDFRTGFESFGGGNIGLSNLNFYDSKNISLDNAHSIYIVDGINNKIKAWENPLTDITDNIYFINGINSSVEVDTIAVPESSSKYNLVLGLFGIIAYSIKNKIGLR